MALYSDSRVVSTGCDLDFLAYTKSYTMYERKGTWYVNFSYNGRQYRVSTGTDDFL
jgi:hypothetical protein